MTKRGVKVDRSKVNSAEPYEMKYIADKLGVSIDAIAEAKKAIGSNNRKAIEKYIKEKNDN